MKTNRNFFSKISKASLFIALAFASLFTVSSQNAARQAFHYKTDFIKQMVYQISNDFFSRNNELAYSTRSNSNEVAAVLVNYTNSAKNLNVANNNNESELGDFLTRAAQLNAPVANVESDQDNTLEFLTSAAQLNAPVAKDANANDDTLDFLLNAAQLNTPVATEENSQDTSLIDFLTKAANLNERVAEE